MEHLLALLVGGLFGIIVGSLFLVAHFYVSETIKPRLVAYIMSRVKR